ncbi:MAG: chorismate-binding protein, partial [Halobacteriovoraceae bacterium]|nr:chorismate-binding protein [Halobacteriovoraceae bacterium]
TIGAYAHCSFIPRWNRLYLSNSPECLFQRRKKNNRYFIYTMPIKGSIKTNSSPWESQWNELAKCQKNAAELHMITDLVSNDLSKIERPKAKVLADRRPLKVPGILHQYSLVEVELGKNTNLGGIVASLFPGGSVTGAPKKQVMKILKKMEGVSRGFYCGSTIVIHQSLMAASINIRSAEINLDKKEMSCHSGGGVTLLSKAKDEYDEMKLKLKSFISIF